MNVKQAISAIREDQLILRSIALGLVVLALVTAFMWQQLVVEPRLQAAEKHYGTNINTAANRVDIYMARYARQLGTIANQPRVMENFAVGNQSALDQLELELADTLSTDGFFTDSDTVYFIDPKQQRHAG